MSDRVNLSPVVFSFVSFFLVFYYVEHFPVFYFDKHYLMFSFVTLFFDLLYNLKCLSSFC